jgi:hypothetical protein
VLTGDAADDVVTAKTGAVNAEIGAKSLKTGEFTLKNDGGVVVPGRGLDTDRLLDEVIELFKNPDETVNFDEIEDDKLSSSSSSSKTISAQK